MASFKKSLTRKQAEHVETMRRLSESRIASRTAQIAELLAQIDKLTAENDQEKTVVDLYESGPLSEAMADYEEVHGKVI